MSETQIPADMSLTVTLAASVWQRILSQLAEGQFKIVGPLIGDLERQLQSSYQRQQAMHADQLKPNGGDRAHAG